jgi:hypothetical protein
MFHRVVFSIFCVASGQLLASTLYNNLTPERVSFNGRWTSSTPLIAVEFTTTGPINFCKP